MVDELAAILETTFVKKQVEGRSLVYQGITRDGNGDIILPDKMYDIGEKRTVAMNHERRINDLIDKAKDYDDMTTLLGTYYSKFASGKGTKIPK